MRPTKTYPDLGDPSKRFFVELSEPEINAIYGFFGYTKGACDIFRQLKQDGKLRPELELSLKFWDHYGPIMQALVDRLSKDFDGK